MYLSVGRRKQSRERGDTLVEVLIAIAVVSLILGGAYTTTNRSLQATRASEERSVALKLAESQIEQIKGLVASAPSTIFLAASPFCISAGLPVTTAGLNTTTGQPTGTFNAACAVDATGAPTTNEPVYRLSVARNTNDFVLTETWTDVGGRNADSMQLRYRLYD
ncbi:MAG TPA: prepilin-type N-terminal cleavage/methylation domain-containing protein [Candidatus Pristimantibacillus sp.]|jgi:prepilin-type N-terminal cleavage/methylation domain-containing protein|nr:prepilin-type N-terminal cleavage/methylation domain-containing protein [Candidatus Pristimantibacillus sp.]